MFVHGGGGGLYNPVFFCLSYNQFVRLVGMVHACMLPFLSLSTHIPPWKEIAKNLLGIHGCRLLFLGNWKGKLKIGIVGKM